MLPLPPAAECQYRYALDREWGSRVGEINRGWSSVALCRARSRVDYHLRLKRIRQSRARRATLVPSPRARAVESPCAPRAPAHNSRAAPDADRSIDLASALLFVCGRRRWALAVRSLRPWI